MLEYESAAPLLITARAGVKEQETALIDTEKKESKESVENVSRELATDSARFPAELFEEHWI